MADYYEVNSKKPNQVFKNEAGELQMMWTAAPAYMTDLMPTKEDPKQVYLNIKKLLLHSPREIDADGIVKLFRRYNESLDEQKYMDFRNYVTLIIGEIEKKKPDAHYSRLEGLKDASRLLRPVHQREVHQMLMGMQHVEEMRLPFCKSVAKAIDKIKSIVLPAKAHAPFGALSMNQKSELVHLHVKKVPESKYRPEARRGNGRRGQFRGRYNNYRNYDRRDDRRDRYDNRGYRDRSRDNYNQRDRNDHYDNRPNDSAPRGSGFRGRRGSRGGRGRGHYQQPRITDDRQTGNDKVPNEKPTKQMIWKHSDTDREAVIEAFNLQDS